jgi:hypothetical protein
VSFRLPFFEICHHSNLLEETLLSRKCRRSGIESSKTKSRYSSPDLFQSRRELHGPRTI